MATRRSNAELRDPGDGSAEVVPTSAAGRPVLTEGLVFHEVCEGDLWLDLVGLGLGLFDWFCCGSCFFIQILNDGCFLLPFCWSLLAGVD